MPCPRRIIAGVSGSPRCLPALRYAADLAGAADAAFIPVHVWVPSGLELAGYQFPSEYLVREWHDAAWQRLWHALEMAFGGSPPGIVAQPVIAQGNAGPVLVSAAGRAGDALVVGTGRRGAVSRLRHGTVSRYCLAHASCPVIAIPPPALDAAAAHQFAHPVSRAGTALDFFRHFTQQAPDELTAYASLTCAVRQFSACRSLRVPRRASRPAAPARRAGARQPGAVLITESDVGPGRPCGRTAGSARSCWPGPAGRPGPRIARSGARASRARGGFSSGRSARVAGTQFF